MDKKHIGRDGAGSSPICNGGSARLRRAGMNLTDFKRVPKEDRCARCNAALAKCHEQSKAAR